MKKCIKARRSGYEEVNRLVWDWFTGARARNMPVSGRMIQERARMYAAEMGYDNFTGSNGWLDRWRKCHDVHFASLCGEGADVDNVTVENWLKQLPTICTGCRQEDIFNADETGLFYWALPTCSMVIGGEGSNPQGGKRSKERVTVLVCCSATGEKLTPLVIGSSKNPCCFKNPLTLPVQYVANKRAWMTNDIWHRWLDDLNHKMKEQGCHILLFIDNCSAHTDLYFTNVKLVYLPPNTTPRLQPCDAGIIQAMKMRYRKQLLRHVLFYMEEASSASNLAKKVNILDAVMWWKMAWDEIDAATIEKCFIHCGFGKDPPGTLMEDVTCSTVTEVQLDSQLETFIVDAGVTWQEYANCDNELDTMHTIELVGGEEASVTESATESDTEDDEDDGHTLSVRDVAGYLEEIRKFSLDINNK